jgi:hypothetical protein
MATKGKRYEGLDNSWISTLDRAHWRMLLAPHTAFFEKLGFRLESDIRSIQWMSEFRDVLLRHEAELPAELTEAFAEIVPLSTVKAGEEFRQLAREKKLDLGAPVGDLTDSELAVRFYLHHHALFMEVYAHAQTSLPTAFAEFFDLSQTSLEGRINETSMKVLNKELGLLWKQQNRTGFSDATHFERTKEVSFLLVHGDTLKAVDIIRADTLKRELYRYNPGRHSTIHIDKVTGRLSINSPHRSDTDQLRQLFGRVFFKNPHQFSASAIYTGAPLLNLGANALSVEGINGLEKVTLLACTIGEPQGQRRRRTVAFTSANLGVDLDLVLRTADQFGANHVDSLKLSLKLTGVKTEVGVNIQCKKDRTQLSVGKREKLDIVYRFLSARGFSVPPVQNLSKAA